MDTFQGLIDTYGQEAAVAIYRMRTRLQDKRWGTPDSTAVAWAVREYEYQQASKDHGCGYDPDDEGRFIPQGPDMDTVTLEQWHALPKVLPT